MKRVAHLTAGMLLGALLVTFAFAVSSRTTSTQDPVKVSPQYYKVLVDNDQIRMLEYRLKPGEKEPLHTHPAGAVYVFTDSKLRNTSPDGTVTERQGKAGDAFWRNPTTHITENVGSTEAHALAVEPKSPCKQ
jgi:quercetin dioxygenase-like cupin family protein